MRASPASTGVRQRSLKGMELAHLFTRFSRGAPGHAKEAPVKQVLLPVLATAMLLTACATDPYGRSSIENRATLGVLIGGAVGALAGHAAGVGPVAGAAAGMAVGGAAGVLIKGPVVDGRQYYRDSQGYCYYIDASGQPIYDASVRC